jgi:hypothetical protein
MLVSGSTLQSDPSLATTSRSGSRPFTDVWNRLPGRIVLSWSMGGGIVAGGLIIAAMTLSDRLSSSALPEISLLLYLLGAAAGVAHGGLLGYLSRDPARTRSEVMGVLLRTLPWVFVGLLTTWVVALWISLTAAVLRSSQSGVPMVVGLFFAWLVGLAICAWALWEGIQGVVAAFRRWPDFRMASVVISVVFAVLATLFLTSPPEIWWTDFRVTGVGAVILAFGASVWIALPVVIAGLRLLHRVRGPG